MIMIGAAPAALDQGVRERLSAAMYDSAMLCSDTAALLLESGALRWEHDSLMHAIRVAVADNGAVLPNNGARDVALDQPPFHGSSISLPPPRR